jgi:3-methyladenine DNA glycosylase AlkC
MADALKTFFSPALVERLGVAIARVHPQFPARAFAARASEGLGRLELLARARHIAAALAEFLPQDYPRAVDVLVRSLGPEHAGDELLGVGLAPFFYLPHVIFVAERGLDHFDESMRAQHELTRRFSAEFSIRAFIARDPERTLAVLRTWTRDENAHVRRLVSEGTRLRLPWAPRVAWLDQHPERVVELLEPLKDDPSTMVRRSVANSLNDLGKVRPDLLTRTCERWLERAPDERRALVAHALRSAVKRGEPAALRLLGYGGKAAVALAKVRFEPPRVPIGGRVAMSFTLQSRSRQAQSLLVDAAVHFVKARGKTGRKVFKVGRVTLAPRQSAPLRVDFSLAVHTTRVPRPGRHAVDVLVNGTALPAGSFEVTPAPSPEKGPRARRARAPAADPVARLRAICLALPEANERISHGEPTWFAGKGKVFAALDDHHHGAEHLSVWLPAGLGAQEALIESDPKRYFRPPYVGGSGWVGVVLDTGPDWRMVSWLVDQAYRLVADRRLVAQLPPVEATSGRRPSRARG